MNKTNFPFLSGLRDKGAFKDNPFILLDVGCKGGIYNIAQLFAPDLKAFGFELFPDEVARLNSSVDKPAGTEYFFMKCVGPEGHMGNDVVNSSDFFNRSSAYSISQRMGVYSHDNEKTEPEEITLDGFARNKNLTTVDFIKTDTDGYDYSILKGAKDLLSKTVLGLQIECAMNGQQSDDANLFRNIDKLLQGYGFSLFDMRLFRYSRGILPQPFSTPDPAQTELGQVSWCDAFYFRDLARPDYEARYNFVPDIHQILKLAALYEIYGLPDCAVELLQKYKQQLPKDFQFEKALDDLTPQSMGRLSYQEYMATFNHMMGMQKIYPFGRIKIR